MNERPQAGVGVGESPGLFARYRARYFSHAPAGFGEGVSGFPMQVQHWPIDKPIPYARNARKISQAAIDKVASSINEFGWRQPIVIDAQNVVIVGHTRVLAARKLGLSEVPVHVADNLTPEQAKTYRLMDNRSHEEAQWDLELLVPEITELQAFAVDLSLTGFDPNEIGRFLADSAVSGLTDDDACPEPPEVPITAPGDLWMLGRHHLLCGDARDGDAAARLLGSSLATSSLPIRRTTSITRATRPRS
jgi:ParB-like chromosome segregation protein Spo0J